MQIEITYSPSASAAKPYLAWINGQMLKTKRGNGRRFKTKEAAEKAARKARPKLPLVDVVRALRNA